MGGTDRLSSDLVMSLKGAMEYSCSVMVNREQIAGARKSLELSTEILRNFAKSTNVRECPPTSLLGRSSSMQSAERSSGRAGQLLLAAKVYSSC